MTKSIQKANTQNKKNTLRYDDTKLVVRQHHRKEVKDLARRYWGRYPSGTFFSAREFFRALESAGFTVDTVSSWYSEDAMIGGGTYIVERQILPVKPPKSVPLGTFAYYHAGSPCQGDLRVVDQEGLIFESHYEAWSQDDSRLTYSCLDHDIEAGDPYHLLVHFGEWDATGHFYPLPLLLEGVNNGVNPAMFKAKQAEIEMFITGQ